MNLKNSPLPTVTLLIPDHTTLSTILPIAANSAISGPLPLISNTTPGYVCPLWAMILSGFIVLILCLVWAALCIFLNQRTLRRALHKRSALGAENGSVDPDPHADMKVVEAGANMGPDLEAGRGKGGNFITKASEKMSGISTDTSEEGYTAETVVAVIGAGDTHRVDHDLDMANRPKSSPVAEPEPTKENKVRFWQRLHLKSCRKIQVKVSNGILLEPIKTSSDNFSIQVECATSPTRNEVFTTPSGAGRAKAREISQGARDGTAAAWDALQTMQSSQGALKSEFTTMAREAGELIETARKVSCLSRREGGVGTKPDSKTSEGRDGEKRERRNQEPGTIHGECRGWCDPVR
jgi:hypothetical protein